MIKSVTYLSEDKKSYELSDESDIQTLDTSVAEGSVARVTGKIAAEYELKGGNWVKTAGGSGSGGSGTMKVTFEALPGETGDTVTADKTFEEVYQAVQNGAYVYAVLQQNPIIYHLMSASTRGVEFSNVTIDLGTGVLQEVLGIGSDNNAVRMIRRFPSESGS